MFTVSLLTRQHRNPLTLKLISRLKRNFTFIIRDIEANNVWKKKVLEIFVERQPRIMFVSTMDSYKLNHRQWDENGSAHLSSPVLFYISRNVRSKLLFIWTEKPLSEDRFFPLKLSMQLLYKKISPDFQSKLCHIIHEIVI